MHMIGEDIEKNNKKLTKFFIPEFIKLYPNSTHIIRELEDIYYNGKVLDPWKLEIFERMIAYNIPNRI